MKPSGGNGAILATAAHDLIQHWDQTEAVWRDRARAEFDNEFLRDLHSAVRKAADALQQIEELLRQVTKECS